MITLLCYIAGNNIGDTGCQYLADALKTNSSVTSIDLCKSNKSIECHMPLIV